MQIGHGKEGVLIGEYCAPNGKSESEESNWLDSNPVLGYIEPACDKPQWILWFMKNGDALLYTKREYGNNSRGGPNHECTGAVEGDPIRISAHNSIDKSVNIERVGNSKVNISRYGRIFATITCGDAKQTIECPECHIHLGDDSPSKPKPNWLHDADEKSGIM